MSASPGKYCIKNTELGPGPTPELMNPSPEEEYQGLHLTEFGYSRYSAMTSESLGWDLGLGISSDCTDDSTVQTSSSAAGRSLASQSVVLGRAAAASRGA